MQIKVAVITGSSKGIGRAVAEALQARGMAIVVSSPDADEAARIAASIGGGGKAVIGVACDVRSAASVQALWDAAVAAFGRVDVWVNNAGLALTGTALADLDEADLRRMLDINVIGTVLGCQVAISGFRAQGGGGAVYNMLGAGADGRPVPGMTGYASSKAAVTFLTRSLAEELAGTDIMVAGLSPGLVITEGFRREHAKVPAEQRAKRDAVVNVIGDRPETIGRWAARIIDTNTQHGRIFTWLTPAKIRRRFAMPGRNVLD